MRSLAAWLTTVVLVTAAACTVEQPRQQPRSRSGASRSGTETVVPDVTGENFLEALGAVPRPFRLLDVRYRVAPEVPNGTILEQRPPAGTSLEETDTDIRVVVSISPGEQLRGTEWVLGMIDGRTWPVGNVPDVTLSFGLRRFEGFSGCNEYSAGYRMDGWRLVLGRVTTTLIACRGERGWVEDRFFEILNGSPAATARQKELRLTSRREGVAVFDQT